MKLFHSLKNQKPLQTNNLSLATAYTEELQEIITGTLAAFCLCRRFWFVCVLKQVVRLRPLVLFLYTQEKGKILSQWQTALCNEPLTDNSKQ